jgi:hypothetical protein
MKNEDLRIEDVLSRANIQGNLLQLQSNNIEKVQSALHTLATMARLADRRDCLTALVGYYMLQVRSTENLEMFIKATELALSPEFALIVLKDLVQKPELSRRRLFMRDLEDLVYRIEMKATLEQAEAIAELIETSVWGEKQKAKFR